MKLRRSVGAVAFLVVGAVFLVGGPASALTSPPAPLDSFKLGVPSDVLEAPGLTASETAAWEELTRNKGGAVAGTPRQLVAPAASKGSSRWLKAGGNIGNLFFALPIAGAVGDAVTNGYFSESAAEGCAMSAGWFGDLTRFAGSLMGFTCDSTDQATQKRDPSYTPINLAPAAGGFPVNAVNGTTSLQLQSAPFWSTVVPSGKTLQEGWVYPSTVNGTGTFYMRFQTRKADGTLFRNTSLAGFTADNLRTSVSYRTQGTFPQCALPTLCLVASGLAVSQTTSDTVGFNTVAAGYGSAFDMAVPDLGPYFSRSVGSAVPPPAAGPGESAMVTLTTTLTDSSATAKTATCTTVGFRETDLLIPKPCEPTLPGGWTTTKHRTVTMQPLGNTDLTKVTPLQDFDTSAGYQDWRTKYPQCSTQVCLLELESVAAGDCFQLGTTCANWNEDPNKATNYRCLYARTVVDIGKCSRYASTFKPNAQANGTVYAPAPGAPAGTQTSVLPTVAEPVPVLKDPETSPVCFPQGFAAFNPVEWILKPVGCALQAAFVPRVSFMKAQLAANNQAWAGKMPAQIMSTITAWNFVAPPSGCNGITVSVFFLGPPFQVMNACPGSVLAGMATWSRLFGNVAFSIYGAVALTRHIGRIFGFGGLGNGEES